MPIRTLADAISHYGLKPFPILEVGLNAQTIYEPAL
jgi:hypothetical protein